jgi:GDP-4-dehydro-6-deoxy-D-mannose reductase
MRVLITGITGFVGSHLAEFALAQGATVFGSVRWRSKTENIEHLRDSITLIDCDLRDFCAAQALIDKSQPDMVFHLAAQSFVPASWGAPSDTLQTNVSSQINLLEAIRARKLDPAIQVAGSSEEYGLVLEHECPIRESNSLRPLSPYAVSKLAQDFLGYQYFKSYGLRVMRTRAFNHSGPRRGDVFVTSNFAKQIVEIEMGLRPPVIHVGNLDARRDFSDVRDIVQGYWLTVQKGTPGEVYNLASGVAHPISTVLDMLLSGAGLAGKVQITPSPDRMRPSDVPLLLGDSSKLRDETGWRTTIPLEKTLSDLLTYWRERPDVRAGRKG